MPTNYTPSYWVWRRHSNDPHLDGYVGATAIPPHSTHGPYGCTFEILLETTDWHEAHHAICTARYGDDIDAHKDANCFICWKRDPSYS